MWEAARDGWTRPASPDNPTRAALDSLDDVDLVFSNAPDSVWRDSGRATAMVPCRIEWFSGAPNDDFDEQVDELVDLVRSGEAAVVVGPAFLTQANCLASAELDAAGLQVAAEWPDGQLYVWPGAQ